MAIVYCLDCDRKLPLTLHQRPGDLIICPACDTEFELVRANPPEIEWLYDEYDDDDYDDDDDD